MTFGWSVGLLILSLRQARRITHNWGTEVGNLCVCERTGERREHSAKYVYERNCEREHTLLSLLPERLCWPNRIFLPAVFAPLLRREYSIRELNYFRVFAESGARALCGRFALFACRDHSSPPRSGTQLNCRSIVYVHWHIQFYCDCACHHRRFFHYSEWFLLVKWIYFSLNMAHNDRVTSLENVQWMVELQPVQRKTSYNYGCTNIFSIKIQYNLWLMIDTNLKFT